MATRDTKTIVTKATKTRSHEGQDGGRSWRARNPSRAVVPLVRALDRAHESRTGRKRTDACFGPSGQTVPSRARQPRPPARLARHPVARCHACPLPAGFCGVGRDGSRRTGAVCRRADREAHHRERQCATVAGRSAGAARRPARTEHADREPCGVARAADGVTVGGQRRDAAHPAGDGRGLHRRARAADSAGC